MTAVAQPPKYEKVNLQEGLPKKDAKEIIDELKAVLNKNENFERFFPDELKKKYEQNFALFDRDGDKYVNYLELQELLISLGHQFPEDLLRELYNHLALSNPDSDGITIDGVYLLVSKKLRESDKEEQLTQAFKVVEKNVNFEIYKQDQLKKQKNPVKEGEEPPADEKEEEGYIRSEIFKEFLMHYGSKWTEEQADEFLKDVDPKGEGHFYFDDLIKKINK